MIPKRCGRPAGIFSQNLGLKNLEKTKENQNCPRIFFHFSRGFSLKPVNSRKNGWEPSIRFHRVSVFVRANIRLHMSIGMADLLGPVERDMSNDFRHFMNMFKQHRSMNIGDCENHITHWNKSRKLRKTIHDN